MPVGTRQKISVAIALAAALSGGAVLLFSSPNDEPPIGPLSQSDLSANKPFVAEEVDVRTVPLLASKEPVFVPPAVEQEDVLGADQQALGASMKAFLARVTSIEVRTRATAILNQVTSPTQDDLARIKAEKELDEDGAVRSAQLKVANASATTMYFQDKVSDLYYLNNSISWDEYVAASWINAERSCQLYSGLLNPGELRSYLGVGSEEACVTAMRDAFTPPHPSEIFVRFPDILQYRDRQRKSAIVTEDDLARYVPLELVREVLKIDNEIARRKSELPTTIPAEQRMVLAKSLTREFEVRARSMLGARGYEILFGVPNKD